jgi:uncharacterized protein (TIGR03086 family)
MDSRIDTLDSIMAAAEKVVAGVTDVQHELPTPCEDFNVGQLLNHIAVWVQVFDAAVNDTTVSFDPSTHQISIGHGDIFSLAKTSILAGLRANGTERMMTMTSSPMPGEFILNMLLMEYVGHAWDLTQALSMSSVNSDAHAVAALAAAQAILQPEYRGTGMFGFETDAPAMATAMQKYVCFIGRDLAWRQWLAGGPFRALRECR